MKIAILCPFSYPSKCGVWGVVEQTAKQLSKKGHEVHIFASNVVKGTSKKSEKFEKHEGLFYHRFENWFSLEIGSEKASFWKGWIKELKKVNPDIVHAHVYRHPHATIVPFIARLMGKKVFLTTHAPFVEKNLRSNIFNGIISIYDHSIGRISLKLYHKVFAIAKWELPFLRKLGCSKEKLVYLPNGVAKGFFKIKPGKGNKVIFLGRVAGIKNLEVLVAVAKKLPSIDFLIRGPEEKGYTLEGKSKNLQIVKKAYTQKEEQQLLKKGSIFVLPSKREGVPLALLEAMAAGLIPVSSATQGGKELIQNKSNGFLFPIGNVQALEEVLKKIVKNKKSMERIRKNAKNSVKEKTWEKIVEKLEREYQK